MQGISAAFWYAHNPTKRDNFPGILLMEADSLPSEHACLASQIQF